MTKAGHGGFWTTEKPSTAAHHTLSPADQCIAIVKEHDPSKVEKVTNLFRKFPGREWNILKRLQQSFNLK